MVKFIKGELPERAESGRFSFKRSGSNGERMGKVDGRQTWIWTCLAYVSAFMRAVKLSICSGWQAHMYTQSLPVYF